jgi:hypothetical protein
MHNPYGAEKYLWGNVPALDVLKLAENEGAEYAEDISLLFAGELSNEMLWRRRDIGES